MTITRHFYRFATLFLLGVFGGTGIASAQQNAANKADVPLPRDVASVGSHRQPVKMSRLQSGHTKVTPKPRKSEVASTLDQADNNGGGDHYQPAQRNLIGQYQNAVTPPVDVQH